MRENKNHLVLVVAATYDHTRQGFSVDYDPQGKFDRWMAEQLEELDARWRKIYPTVLLTASHRGAQPQ